MALLQSVGGEVERVGRTATRAGEPCQRNIVQIDRAQSRRPRPGNVGCGLQDIELCSQTGGEICLRNLKRFIGRLHTFRCRFEHGLALLKIEKCAPHFRGDGAPRGFERRHCRFAARAGGLHSAFGRETVEKMPGRIYPDQITVIEFLSDKRIALVVNFVPRKNLNMWTKLTAVDQILSIFNFDVDLARFDFGAVRIGAAETFVQVGMEGCVLQLSRDFETRLVRI